MRHTKIIVTIGPASSGRDVVEQLVGAGVNVFRLNFSHSTHETHHAVMDTIRSVAAAAKREVGILQDLSGPKIRTGELAQGTAIALKPDDALEIVIGNEPGRPGRVSTTYAPLAKAVKAGDRLLLDDGKIELLVEAASPESIKTRVLDGGDLGAHKGINAPNVPLPAVGVTAKDEADLRFGLSIGVDLVALSFVQSASDISRARAITADAGRPHVPIVAKLERPEAIERLDEIIAASDAVMVARGDLGLELPLEHVPQVQKRVLAKARARGVPAIIATQVLESMRSEWRPTRAEVSDAAGAVDGGADAIMLSGETAVGDYPVRAVQVLDAVIRSAEAVPPPWTFALADADEGDHISALCDAAVTLAWRAQADAIVGVLRDARSARLLAARRPAAPIFAITDSSETAHRLCLWWGVTPVVLPVNDDRETTVSAVRAALHERKLLTFPATIVMVSGHSALDESRSNFLRIRVVK